MGFMDKIKNAAKSAAKGALVMAAKSYGTVTKGRYKLCKISMNSTFDKLTFIKLTEIEGEHIIAEDIETFQLSNREKLSNGSDMYTITIFWKNSEEVSEVLVKSDVNQGSALPSPERRLAAQYKDVEPFVTALAKHTTISEDTLKKVNLIRRYAGQGPLEQ